MNIYLENIYQLFGPKSQDYWPSQIHELPKSYSDGTLMLMPVEPGRVYAYWDLWEDASLHQEDLMAQLDDKLGNDWQGKGPLLKIYEMADSDDLADAIKVIEHHIEFERHYLFLELDWPQKRYRAELGFITKPGTFLPLVLSNGIGMQHGPLVLSDDTGIQHGSFALKEEPIRHSVFHFLSCSREGTVKKKLRSSAGKTSITVECENKFMTGISSPIPSFDKKP